MGERTIELRPGESLLLPDGTRVTALAPAPAGDLITEIAHDLYFARQEAKAIRELLERQQASELARRSSAAAS